MAGKDIKLNPDETLGHVSKIAATMAEVSVPGPVPPPVGADQSHRRSAQRGGHGSRRESRGFLRCTCRARHRAQRRSQSRPWQPCGPRKKRTPRRSPRSRATSPEAGITEV